MPLLVIAVVSVIGLGFQWLATGAVEGSKS
jgi:hypothetical protein